LLRHACLLSRIADLLPVLEATLQFSDSNFVFAVIDATEIRL